MTTAASSRLSALTAGPALLPFSLRLDAVVTTANGLAYLALAGPLENLLGLDAGLGRAIGVFLTVYGLAVAVIGTRDPINRTATAAVAIGNSGWVVASLAALISGALSLTTVGAVWAVLQSITVGAFAALQYLALRRTR
ncbi:hypothetical protein [Nocardia sp. AG03]|uniref:hypothetical protein n=1 Tax=Nocardia sp. AG03 TaxID=3025312 RepID=UPI0024189880|nr:hypothetical protein [Nocardia sp. AG03]